MPAAAEPPTPAGEAAPAPKAFIRVMSAEDVALALTKLEEAARLFQAGHDNGRAGADIALQVALIVLRHALGLEVGDPRLAPIHEVIAGLVRLDEGATPQLFQPAQRLGGGSPGAGQGENTTKVMAVFTARRLVRYLPDDGNAKKSARRLVAEALNQMEFTTVRAKLITERTVREWDEAISADPKGEMALTLADIEAPFEARDPEQPEPIDAKDRLITALRDTIAKVRSAAIL